VSCCVFVSSNIQIPYSSQYAKSFALQNSLSGNPYNASNTRNFPCPTWHRVPHFKGKRFVADLLNLYYNPILFCIPSPNSCTLTEANHLRLVDISLLLQMIVGKCYIDHFGKTAYIIKPWKVLPNADVKMTSRKRKICFTNFPWPTFLISPLLLGSVFISPNPFGEIREIKTST